MKRKSTILIITSICLLFLLAGVRKYQPQKGNNNNITKLEYISANTPASYRLPGEFEKQQAIWLQWPSEVYNTGNHPVSPVIVNVIKAFDPFIRVNVMTRSKDEITQIKALLKSSGYTGTNVRFFVISHMSIWTRDVGPVFVMNSNNRLSVVDFGFNNYSRDGNQAYINVESQVDKLVAQRFNLPVIATGLISEGGAIESNGKGTLMTTESVVLKRNPGMTKQQIENEYKRVFGLKKIIWLKKGLAEDDRITSGHINEIARFAGPNTILLAQILPGDRYTNNFTKESYLRLEENYNILRNSTNQDGKPFRIIRVPMPPTVYGKPNEKGKTPIRSYLNYAATNGAILFQSYWKPGLSTKLRDTENGVIEIFRGVFPGRKIIVIDSENVNLWGGGLHCITQHMPAE